MAEVTLFMAGDVMTGRGVDQVFPQPSQPRLHEPFMRDARGYVALAEKAYGPIEKPVSDRYIWGEMLTLLSERSPDVCLVNLETSLTTSEAHWPGKAIHYRMHPANIGCLNALPLDICALANNHILDWGYGGLEETLETLEKAKIQFAGAGQSAREAQAPATVQLGLERRLLLFSVGSADSGIPPSWEATAERPGVWLLPDFSLGTVRKLGKVIAALKRGGDVVVLSIHWGGNWGYPIAADHRQFAHWLIDEAGVDVVHGHSSHHVRGIEVYGRRLILYGCGDLLNDYEGISGYESYRGDLGLMYFARLEASTGELIALEMLPTQMRHFQLNYASAEDILWLAYRLNRESQALDTQVSLAVGDAGQFLQLRWNGD